MNHLTGSSLRQPASFVVGGCAGVVTLLLAAADAGFASEAEVEHLSDHPEMILAQRQDWGVLGWDVAAHLPDETGQQLQIGEKRYSKGLGHHANGTIAVLLDGGYASFDADVGLQPCEGGSVVFRAFVDGVKRFESGVLRSGDAPQEVHLALAGAQELRLEASDAGDGISCDMANWANARLHCAVGPSAKPSEPPVDIARFGRVVTYDPNRQHGTRATRIEEFPAEDLFLETDLPQRADGNYTVPVSTNGLACIGIEWLNRRSLRELQLAFVDAAALPATNSVQVQGWFGESRWQGEWKTLAGELATDGPRLVFRAAPRGPVGGLLQTWKVRWVFPASKPEIVVRQPMAFTRSRWDKVVLQIQFGRPGWNECGLRVKEYEHDRLEAINGEIVGDSKLHWKKGGTQRFTLRYSRSSALNSDPTMLRVCLAWDYPAPPVLCLEDVLTNECVYLPDVGVLVCRADKPVSFDEYKHRIAKRQTILQQVRTLPDQTLAQAMAKTHHDAQSEGPVMLSLACDNHKFVVERDGTVRFQTTAPTSSDWFASAGALRPQLGDGKPDRRTRQLDGGWLPIPVIETERNGVRLLQRTFVAPLDESGTEPRRLNRPCVCVAEFNLRATQAGERAANLSLSLKPNQRPEEPLVIAPSPTGFLVTFQGRPIALVDTTDIRSLKPVVAGPMLTLAGAVGQADAARCVVFLFPPPPHRNAMARLPEAAKLRANVEAHWNAWLAPAMQIETPDAFLNNLIRSSQVRCLIAARNEADGARIAPWIAAMSYGPLESEAHSVIRGMDFLGHADFAQRGLDYFIHRYNTNGFLTTGYTTFGTAWHLWTLGEHYQLTRDTNWLRQVAPEIKRVGGWIIRQAGKTKVSIQNSTVVTGGASNGDRVFARRFPARRRADADGSRAEAPDDSPRLEYALMPPGVMADWNAYAYHFCLDAYYAAALRGLAEALAERRDPEAPVFRQEANSLAAYTETTWDYVASQSPVVPLRNGTWVRYYPSQLHSPGKLGEFFPGQDAGRSWCYDVELGAHQLVPTGVLDPLNRRVTAMMNHMEDVQFLADGWFDYPAKMSEADWFNLGGFSKVQPYYTRNCEIYALRDDIKPFIRSYFNTLAAMVNPEVLTMWEHFHHSGAWDKTHETGYFLHQTRTMLVQERGDELWLAPFITTNWLADGRVLSVANAPTHFGQVSFRVTSHLAQGHIDARIEPPTRQLPRAIVLRLRHPAAKPIRAVTVNGRPCRKFDRARGTVTLPANARALEVQATF